MPTASRQEYVRPANIAAAVEMIGRGPRVAIVAGGTDLLLRIPPEAKTLVDLSDLDLDYVRPAADGIRVGAMTTLTTMADDRALGAMANGVIPSMMVHVGSPLIRNLATIGGHLVRGRLSDVVPVLAVLGTRVKYLDGTGERVLPLLEFYEQRVNRQHILLTEIMIPTAPPGAVAAFRRFSQTAYDMALMNCSVWLAIEDGEVGAARIVFGDTPAVAAPAPGAAAQLVGASLHPRRNAEVAAAAAAEITVGHDGYASGAYRRQLAEVLARRCLDDLSGAPA